MAQKCAAHRRLPLVVSSLLGSIVVLATLPATAAAQLPAGEAREPFKIFDDLYYVGIDWVSAYLLVTDDGLVLIDSLYGDFVDPLVESIRELGFDPADVRYVLPTHGHYDHAGGAAAFQRRFGAKVGMTEKDWELSAGPVSDPEWAFELPQRDLVLRDGDTLELGGKTIRFFVTPGHTEGVLSMRFPVRDGERTHDVFLFGGVGLNFEGADRYRTYLASVARIRGFEGIDVNLTNHPQGGRIFERAALLAQRGDGDTHPFVDPVGFASWLESLVAPAEARLEALTRQRRDR
jgi:metallo-beta-lactamase class B